MELGYIGSQGKHLRIQRNFNQFIYPNGKATRPYATLSTRAPSVPARVWATSPTLIQIRFRTTTHFGSPCARRSGMEFRSIRLTPGPNRWT